MKYVHTNLIAKDWRKLSKFYQTVFNCKPVKPERNLSGEWLEQLTGILGAKLQGEHLRLPGFEENAPTLEIFSYQSDRLTDHHINTCGFSHIAFEVTDVRKYVNTVIAAGGSLLGDIVTRDYGQLGIATFAYTRDPEGNFIELQSWDRSFL